MDGYADNIKLRNFGIVFLKIFNELKMDIVTKWSSSVEEVL